MIGLSLSGGGAKGAFEVGVLEYMREAVGAPLDSQLSQYVTYLVMCWDKLGKTEDVWTKLWPWQLLSNPCIGNNEPLRRLLGKLVDYERTRQGVPVEVAAWDMESGETRWLRSLDARDEADLISMVMASCSFPVAFPPEPRKEGFLTDGGITTIQPLDACIKAGCGTILAVSCRNPNVPERHSRAEYKTPIDAAMRYLDGMENEIAGNDVKSVELWNLLVDVGHALARGKRKIVLDHIAPSEPLGNPLDFSPGLTQRRRAQGRKDARAYFDLHPQQLHVYAQGFDFGAGTSVGAVNILGLAQRPRRAAQGV